MILEGERDLAVQIQHQAMSETIGKAMATTLANHNEILLNCITNAIKEAFNLNTQNRGPTYSVSAGNRQIFIGQTSRDHVSRELANRSQHRNTVQQSVQQPVLDYGQSAIKIAPHSRRLARDFNAPPYQGRLAPREVPPGYHYVSKHYTLNGCENPGYQPNNQRIQNYGYPEPNNQQGTQFQIDQLMGQVTDMVQRQFGLKLKNTTVSYKKPYPEWFDQVLLPPRYRLPDFVKFTGTSSTLTMEHVSQYLA